MAMEFRRLGASGLRVPVLQLGTGTFGGKGEFFGAWGNSDAAEASRLVDLCLEAGLNMFDSADIYSHGAAEEVLGAALRGRRDKVLISTKATFRSGEGSNDVGASRFHLLKAVDEALARLRTDWIDVFQLHGFDAMTPVEETLSALDALVRAGKVRYVGCSNYSGWQLMKSLATSDRYGWPRYVVHQAYYSLIGREYEWELMPLGLDQGVGCAVWSPLGWARLTGKLKRGNTRPEGTRLTVDQVDKAGPQVEEGYLFQVLDAIEEVGKEVEKSVPQVALNWLMQRPTVSTIIIGARNEEQLRSNLGAVGWKLTPEQVARLDKASERPKTYPYWHQAGFAERNPFPT